MLFLKGDAVKQDSYSYRNSWDAEQEAPTKAKVIEKESLAIRKGLSK